MFIIIEWNGFLPEGWIGEIVDRNGRLRVWNTYLSAETWAKKHCAFEYKIVNLNPADEEHQD